MLAKLILLEGQVALLALLIGRSELQGISVDGFWNSSLLIRSALDNVWVSCQWVAESLFRQTELLGSRLHENILVLL